MSVQAGQILKEEDSNSNSGDLKNQKKKYSVIPQEVREKFIKRVISHEVTIKEAAKEFGIKFSTSKAILQTFKREGRIGKKKSRQRKPRIMKKLIAPTSGEKSSQKASKVVPVVIYKTQGSIAKTKQEANNFPASSNPQTGYNSPLDIENFDPEMKSTIQEMQNTLSQNYRNFPQQNAFMSPQLNYSPYMGPTNMYYYQYQSPQQMYYNQFMNYGMQPGQNNFQDFNGMNGMKRNDDFGNNKINGGVGAMEFPNPFLGQTSSNNLQVKRECHTDLQEIKQQINQIDVEKIRQQANLYQQKQDQVQELQEFNYGYYFE